VLTATCIVPGSSPHRVGELLDEESVIAERVGRFTLDMVCVAAATDIETKSSSTTNIENSSLATVRLGCIQPTVIRNEAAPDVICRPRPKYRSTNEQCGLLIGWLNVRLLTPKTLAVHEEILSRHLDVMILTETWHGSTNDISLRQAAPMGYVHCDQIRLTNPSHGGIVVLYRAQFVCRRLDIPQSATFECICLQLRRQCETTILLSIYRPGSMAVTNLFFEELAAVLEVLVVYRCPVVIGGDLNILVDDVSDRHASHFIELLTSFGLVQHFAGPTHTLGHTLDLIITDSEVTVKNIQVEPPGSISDHGLLTAKFSSKSPPNETSVRLARCWRNVDRLQFKEAIEGSALCASFYLQRQPNYLTNITRR